MKEEYENIALIKNDAENKFQMTVDGHTAFILFKERENIISLIHTESPDELAGRGVATAIIEKTLQYLDENNYTLVPLCPLVYAYIKRHLDWTKIVRDDFKEKLQS